MEVVLRPQRWPLSGGGYQDSLNGRRQLKRFASQPCSVQSVRWREGSSLSRIHILMIACRETLSLIASRSSMSTIHEGKSTLTL